MLVQSIATTTAWNQGLRFEFSSDIRCASAPQAFDVMLTGMHELWGVELTQIFHSLHYAIHRMEETLKVKVVHTKQRLFLADLRSPYGIALEWSILTAHAPLNNELVKFSST